jgi:hypothetical protein
MDAVTKSAGELIMGFREMRKQGFRLLSETGLGDYPQGLRIRSAVVAAGRFLGLPQNAAQEGLVDVFGMFCEAEPIGSIDAFLSAHPQLATEVTTPRAVQELAEALVVISERDGSELHLYTPPMARTA